MTRAGVAALVAGLAARHRHRHSVRLHPGRRQRDPDLPQLRHREEAVEAQGRVRHHRRDRRRGRAGSGQQRRHHGDADPAADARHPDLEHDRRAARRVPELRHPARAAAVRQERGAGLGADRVAVHRQRDAADPEPAAGRAVGQAVEDSEAAAVRRHPDLRHRRRLRHAPVGVRPRAAVRDRPARRRHAALRFPDRAGRRRHDPRTAGRSASAQRDVDRRRQVDACSSSGRCRWRC